jgi:hypothetical protein
MHIQNNHLDFIKSLNPSSEFLEYVNRKALEDCLDYSFLGFLDHYYYLAQSFMRKDSFTIIVDIGSASAIQQIFFSNSDCFHYIAVESQGEVELFYPNTSFIKGQYPIRLELELEIKKVYKNIKLSKPKTIIKVFGIASYSIGCTSTEEVIEEFHLQFPNSFIIS